LDAVLYIKVAQEILVRRLSGRWMCRAAGHVFHDEFHQPLVPGVCDHDGSELYQRNDDRAETVAERIRVYIKQTAPLIDYYRQRGLLVAVDGDQSIEAVTGSLMAVLPEGTVQ
jgi:adenylate kinase